MNFTLLIPAVLVLIAALGAVTAYFARSRGVETIRLLQINIQSYKDAEKLKDARIAYLEGQLTIKDETIKRLLNDGNISSTKK